MSLTEAEIVQLCHEGHKIAIVYSKSELNEYFLELRSTNDTCFVKDGEEIAAFDCLEVVKKEAKNAGASQAFLALDNVYDEFGADEVMDRFTFTPLPL